ncbi:hypothetical protein L5D93_01485 [Paenibacillus thiaminolyticus]|nr:hypothetical protein [Paenibacillus thiaminolyticus]
MPQLLMALAAEEGGGSKILHYYRNLRHLIRYFVTFLQKCIISADFCFLSIAQPEIPAVLQESLQRAEPHNRKLYFYSISTFWQAGL